MDNLMKTIKHQPFIAKVIIDHVIAVKLTIV